MKRFGKFLLGMIVFGVIGVGTAFYFTSGLADRAENFFKTVRAGNHHEAYDMFSEVFKRNFSEADMIEFLKFNDLTDVAHTSWNKREVQVGQGTIEGIVTTGSGGAVPLKISFVKENTAWKIIEIEKKAAGLVGDTGTLDEKVKTLLPPEVKQIALVKESMKVFGESINEKSMAKFHSHISEMWRGQYDIVKLDEAYRNIFNIDGDLVNVSELTPVFSEPAKFDQNGVMYLVGYFPTQPSKVNFAQRFIREGTRWKLVGFDIHISGQDT